MSILYIKNRQKSAFNICAQERTASTLLESYRFCTPFVFSRIIKSQKTYSRFSHPLAQAILMACSGHRYKNVRKFNFLTFLYLCPGEDSNLHALTDLSTSRINVYQFRHLGILQTYRVQRIIYKFSIKENRPFGLFLFFCIFYFFFSVFFLF